MKANRPYNLRRKALAILVAACYASAHAAPVNPTVVAGQATFNQQGKTFTITNTPNAIINWQGFSIGADEITRFIQQSSDSKVLNRVTGLDPSQILGSLQSNGKVFLINPNGVLFGAGARVDVNGLVASSLNISNADFLAGKNNFTAGDVAGQVSNQGTITTPSGGQIFLIAPAVENSGIISAPNGDVVLAAGHSVQLFDSKDPNVQVVVSSPADQALNLGSIVAQGGRVGVYGALVNQRGVINANSAVRGENGQIVLKASGTTLVEAGSTTTATGSNLNTGGDIMLLGQQVGVTGNALVDASGAAGGGTLLVGGDYQGKNASVMNAQQAYVGKEAVLRADASDSGNGGKVVVWSDQATQMLGAISARGGAQGGNGGQVETSGHYLDMQGTVDTRAPKGANGSLLLDPSDVYIADNLSIATGSGMLCCNTLTPISGLFLDTAHIQDSLLLTSVLQTALETTNVTVSTANTNGTGSGAINVLSPLTVAANRTLNLVADSNIALKSSINGGGALNMTAGGSIVQTSSPIDALTLSSVTALAAGDITLQNSGNSISGLTTLTSSGDVKLQAASLNLGNTSVSGSLALDATGAINASGSVTVGGAFKLQSGDWIQNSSTLPSFSAGDFQLTGGTFLRVQGGLGTLQSPFQLADIYGLQGAATLSLSRSYVLVNDISADGTAGWSGGFVPIASDGGYTGTFDGASHIISGLKISQSGQNNIGMFSSLSSGTIRDLTLSNVDVSGNSSVGGLVGYVTNGGGTIGNVSVSGVVRGVGNVGALVGSNGGAISNAISSGTVNGSDGYNASNIGGLVGVNTGAISLSSSSAAVNGDGQGYTGGLVGSNTKTGNFIGSVTQSFSSGAVYSSGEIVGGLIGDNNGGTLTLSYATGAVNGGRNVGGLVGRNTNGSSISNAYATGNVSGNTDASVNHGNIGGLAGDLFDGSVSNVYSSGTVSGNGFYNVYGLVGSIESGTLANGYFNQTTAGTGSDAAGGIGLTMAQMQQQGSYTSLDFSNTWRIYNGHTTPLLKNFLTAVTVNVAGGSSVSKTYDGQSAAFTGTTGTLASGIEGTLGFDGAVNVGTYSVGGLWSSKYDISYTGNTPLLTITPAALTVNLASHEYNNSTVGNFANATLGGVLNGGLVSLVSSNATATYADKNVGVAKLVTVGGTPLSLSGGDAGNYVISGVTGDITARPLSTWIATGPGLWSTAGNWADGIAPDGANVLAASLGSSAGLITYDTSAGNTTLATLLSSGAPLALTGGKLTLTGKGDFSSNLTSTLTQNGGALEVQGQLRANTLVLTSGVLTGAAGSQITTYGLNQTGGVIDSSGGVTITGGGSIALGNIRAQNLTLNAGEVGSITQNSGTSLVADSVHASAAGDISLTNTNNHVSAFDATVFGQGSIALTNTVLSGELALGPLTATHGNIIIDNHGGIHTAGTITGGSLVSITAHSPVTINDAVSGSDIQLAASTEITLNGGSQLVSTHSIGLTAGTNIQLGGILTVPTGGSISAVATNGSISTMGGTVINSSGAAVSLSAPNGSISTQGGTFGSGTALTVTDGSAAAAAAAAAKAAADAAAAAAAKAAADAAAKAAADAAAKAAADAAAKAAADAAAKAAADAAAKAASDAAAAQAAADAAAKAAADAAAKAAADSAAKAAADAAAKAAADAAAKAAADAAAKAAADAAAAAAAQGSTNQPVSQALNSTVNIINSASTGSQSQGSTSTASGGNSAPDAKTPDDKSAAGSSKTDTANAKDPTKKMYCN